MDQITAMGAKTKTYAVSPPALHAQHLQPSATLQHLRARNHA